MESSVQKVPITPSAESRAIEAITDQANRMTGWLKFLGIISIIQGALAAISIVGIIIAWIPIWLGVLLFQAGSRATNARLNGDPNELAGMMEKLKMYFIIQGILIIVIFALIILGIIFFSSLISLGFQQLGNVRI